AGRAALTISGSPEGALSKVRVVISRTQEALTAHADDVAGDRLRAGVAQPRDGLGDVDRLTALRQRAEQAPGGADAQRHRLDHVGLDEGRRDGVRGDLDVGDLRRERLHEADHAGLGGAVVRLTVVARDAGDRRDPDDPAARTDELV